MTVSIPFKRGDTFVIQNTVSINSVAQDITNWTIASKVRQGSAFVDELVITKVDAVNGVFQVKKQDTTLWPAKTIQCDIQYTLASGQVISTETFDIAVAADVTF
ncbi:MAG: hypothetical protein IPQ23_22210 [Cytophagaceae bacterium]|nr:hypothetical protein [Cytophagaceae bacterium]